MKKGVKVVIGVAALAVVAGGVAFAVVISRGGEQKKDVAEVRAELDTDFVVSYDGIKTASIRAGGSVHDPSIMEVDGTYYIYGSHMTAAKSTDLRHWTMLGDGYAISNPVYGTIMKNQKPFLYTGNQFSEIPTDDGGTHIWAPDVKYNEKAGLYYMYGCTSSTWNASNLYYATSKSPEGPFEWKEPLIYSGFNKENIGKTDVLDYVTKEYAEEHYMDGDGYNFKEYPNAIDPTVFTDADGRLWMVYGSWSGGIYLLELDSETGKVIHPKEDLEHNVDPYFGKRLMGGGHTSMEAPYIVYDKEAGYYYLYVSYGGLTREGGYQIRVFRSKTPDGDYVDMNDKAPMLGKGNPSYFGLKLSGNYNLPSLEKAYMATGHNSALIASDGKRYICNHTRFDDGTEYHEPRVHQYLLNEEKWPCMLPYATSGETVSATGYDKSRLTGEYFMINQKTAVDAVIAEPVKIVLTEDGQVIGKDTEGTWEVKDGKPYVHMTFENVEYSGVFCEMKDEADTQVMTFSAVGANESIWGVKYDK